MVDPGEGMQGVMVRLFNSAGAVVAERVTDINGQYAFGGVPAGTYTVRVDTATLPGTAGQLTNSTDPDGGTAHQSSVTLSAGQINLAQDFGYRDLTTPNTISGTLWEDRDGNGALAGGETNRYVAADDTLYDPIRETAKILNLDLTTIRG